MGVAVVNWGVPGTAYCCAMTGKGGSAEYGMRPQVWVGRSLRSNMIRDAKWRGAAGSVSFAMVAEAEGLRRVDLCGGSASIENGLCSTSFLESPSDDRRASSALSLCLRSKEGRLRG